jgi:hypothetical protein
MHETSPWMKTLVLVVVFCVVLFFAGLIAPRRSKRLQAWYDRVLRRGERKSAENAGKVGDLTGKGLRRGRRAGDRSAETGRKLHQKLPGD